jgi:hypothetical protein
LRGEVMKAGAKRLIIDENGAVMMVAMVLLIVGALIFTPLLGLMGTGLMSGQVYEETMHGLYAADAGVEDALWQIKNDQVAVIFPQYDAYDYYEQWGYNLTEDVNDKPVGVTIQNVWIPLGISVPDAYTARQIIEEGKVIITGSPALVGSSKYEIKIGYDPCGGIPAVKTIGIWLPACFDYDGDCSLEDEDYYSEPVVTPYKGGCAVVWSFSPFVSLAEFADSFTFRYSGPQGQIPSAALSWIDTTWSGIIPGYTWDADVNVYKITSTATDPDTGGETVIESYTSKVELRRLGSAVVGDYLSIGNTLMTPTDSIYYRSRLFRESSATIAQGDIPSNAMIEAAFLYWSGWIEEGSEGIVIIEDTCSDFNAPPVAWTHGSAWDISYGEFRGTAYNKYNPGRYLTMSSDINLSAYVGRMVEVSWEQDESGDLEDSDRLYFAFSADGGSTWSADYEAFSDDNPLSDFAYTIPETYVTANFRMRFYLYGFGNRNEYCYIDDIRITADLPLVEIAKVNRVMFGTTGNMTQITAAPDDCQVEPTPDAVEGSWSYSCYYDATDIVDAQLDPSTKTGTFTLGHVLEGSGYNLYPSGTTGYPLATPAQKSWFSYPTKYQWTYAGWSLLIIYSSPGTRGHQLYLFDTFRYVGLDTLLTFSIYNFLAPDDTTGSHLTYFVGEGDNHYSGDYIKVNGYQLPLSGDPYEDPPVNPQNNVFNSYSNSLDDPYLSGVDIDTFDASDCIAPGDTTAEVILDNGQEIYNFVYIILSFRSLVTGGGIMGYLIRG